MSEQLKNKILNMEVAPPAAAWDFIAARLDEQTTGGSAAVQLKMNQLEVAPPAFVWDEIEKELDKNAEKVIPFNQPKTKRLVYAVAAVLVGVIGYNVVNYYLNSTATTTFSSPESVTIAGNNQNQSPDTSNPVVSNDNQTPGTNNDISSAPSNTTSRLPLETEDQYTKNTYAYNDVDLQKVVGEAIGHQLSYNPEEGVKILACDIEGDIPGGINAVTANKNYFITTGPNGEVVRVSNKLADIIQSKDNETGNEENINTIEKNDVWKQRYNELRNKLSKLAPSPTNFMDIIQLASLLKEEKKP